MQSKIGRQDVEQERFKKLMVYTSKLLRKYAPDFSKEEILLGYYRGLSHIGYEVLAEACKACVENMDQFPSVATLRRLCTQPGTNTGYVPCPEMLEYLGDYKTDSKDYERGGALYCPF